MRNLSPQVHLVTTYHPRRWEDMLLRCSLDADASGVSDWCSAAPINYIFFFYLNGPLAQLVRALGP